MKKKICILIILMLLTLLTVQVNAASTTASFTSSVTSVKAGDTVKITLSLSNSNAINGVSTSLNFDSAVFELQSIELQDATKYSLLNKTADNITLIATDQEGSTTVSLDITFKVKDNVTAGTTTVSTGSISVDQLNEDSQETLGAKSTGITVEGTANNDSEKQDEEKEEPKADDKSTIDAKTPETTTSGASKNEQSSSIPKTGINDIIIISLATVAIASTVFYIKYKKYRNI